jgi:hypothetical protein
VCAPRSRTKNPGFDFPQATGSPPKPGPGGPPQGRAELPTGESRARPSDCVLAASFRQSVSVGVVRGRLSSPWTDRSGPVRGRWRWPRRAACGEARGDGDRVPQMVCPHCLRANGSESALSAPTAGDPASCGS